MNSQSKDSSTNSKEGKEDVVVEAKFNTLPSTSASTSGTSDEQSSLSKSFPWMAEFNDLCQKDFNNTSVRNLEKLMNIYYKNVYQSVTECYSRPNRAVKLKRSMADTLLFFHLTSSEFKQPIEHSSYQAKMSDLMALYMDLEIKASRTGTESTPKIASKLTSCLHVYFGRSHDHILDTILKTKFINKNSWELSDLLFRRVLRDSPGSSMYVISYIRYILAFKLWKSIMKMPEDRRKITKLAQMKLQPPPGFREKLTSGGILRDILPRIPKGRNDITLFLLQAKYSARDKVKLFLKAIADPKLQCALDRQSFTSSIYTSSNSDGREDNESNGFMSDTWSSMGLEYGIRDSLCTANIAGGSNGKRGHMLKHGGRSKNKNDNMKKKKKELTPEEIGEDDKDKNSPEPAIEDPTVNAIKSEVEGKEQLNQVDNVCEGDTLEVAAEVELPASPSEIVDMPDIKLEPQPSQSKEPAVYPAVWGMPTFQSYYNNVGCYDYVDSKSDEFSLDKTPDGSDQINVFDILNKDELSIDGGQTIETCSNMEGDGSVAQGLGLFHHEEHVVDDSKTIDALRAQGILYENPMKGINASSQYGIDNNRFLHDQTVKVDGSMFNLQSKACTYGNKLSARSWSNVLTPLFSELPKFEFYRCTCNTCKTSHTTIQRNWKTVTTSIVNHNEKLDENGRNSDDFSDVSTLEVLKSAVDEVKDNIMYCETEINLLFKKIEEKEDNEHSSLPLKKRKAFSYSSYVKDEKPEMSYPCTPMMSIAHLELEKEKCRFNTMAMNHTPITCGGQMNYVTNYSAINNYPILGDTVIVQADNKNIVLEQNFVPGAFTTTFVTNQQEQQRIKFKTPAQLKEFQHLSAAQDLINFAHTSRTYCNEKPEPEPPKVEKQRETRQTRQKAKASTRKRKRTT